MATASINLSASLPLLLRRKWTILLSGFVTACLAVGILRAMPTVYTSQGGLLVENSEPNDPELGLGIGMPNPNNDGVVLTQVEVLRSRGVIDKVVDDLDLAHQPDLKPVPNLPQALIDAFRQLEARIGLLSRDPVEDAIDYVQKTLKVQASEHSSVITISFQAGSPAVASSVIKALMTTYLSNDITSRQAQIAKVTTWLSERTASLKKGADNAAQAVENFVRDHEAEHDVMGSSATAYQLSKDQEKLAELRGTAARLDATLDSIARSGGSSVAETLNSKTITIYKDREALIVEQMARLSPADNRRTTLQQELQGIRGQINAETDRIVTSLRHDSEVAHAQVQALDLTVLKGAVLAHNSAINGAKLAQLKNIAEAQRQMYVSFGSRSEQTQLAAAHLPSARVLFAASIVPYHSLLVLAVLCGFFVGMIGAIGLIILRETMSTRIDTTAKMALVTGLPVSGCLPEVRRSRNRDLLSAVRSKSKIAAMISETLRGMWLAMRTEGGQGEGITVIVTSSEVGEGKTTVATALARKIAADGYRVLLIDADLRRPQLASMLKLRPVASLEAVLRGSCRLGEAVQQEASGLHCLLSEGDMDNPMRVLGSETFAALLAESKSRYEFVVLDSPPVLRVTDAVQLARYCAHVLFVVGSGVSSELVSEAVHRFPEEERGKMLTLLTRVPVGEMDRRDYFGGYAKQVAW